MTPFVVTFYSFKGGVGRTVLAANIAALLARSGKTLLWDLDIEAPGLHRIGDLASAKANRQGFFEWLYRWQDKRKFDGLNKRDFDLLAKSLLPVDRQRNLHILPAHGDDADFAALYRQIEWERFLRQDHELGLALFRGVIDYLGTLGFRYIVLDSRTGITDIGGYLAALLPHVTVLMGNYGVQNTAGLRMIWNALQRQVSMDGSDPDRAPLPPLRLEMVASPVPKDDAKAVAAMRQVWQEYFHTGRIFEIDEYTPLRLGEHLPVLTGGDSPIVAQYARLAERLQAIDAERLGEESAADMAIAARPDTFDPRDPRYSRAAQGKRFEDRVAGLLRLLGYRVEPEQTLDGNRVDLIATLKHGLDEAVYLVECKDHAKPKGKDVVEKLKTWLDTTKARALNARGMVVARRFSPQAVEFAKSVHIRLFTPEDLERELLNFSPYLARLVSEFGASPLAACYVDQRVVPEKAPDKPQALLPYAAAWANGEGSRLWVLLGDYGTGKTAFTKRFAYDLAQRAIADPEAPTPLLINLKDYPNKASLAEVLHEHWTERTGERRDPALFMHLLQYGRIVLLLDSFDEMGVAQAHRDVVQQFSDLVLAAGQAGENLRANRILVTCREQYFRDKSEAERAAAGLESAARRFDGSIDQLPRFDDDQIKDYLAKRLGKQKGNAAWKTILGIYDLKALADRPQLLDIIIGSLPTLSARGEAVNAGTLYRAYTDQWLNDPSIRPKGMQVKSHDLLHVLETLALELWRREGQRIHHGDLYNFIKRRSDLRGTQDPASFDVELRTAAFLSRSPDGYYAFSHRSFLEFFLARAIHCALKGEDDGLAEVLDNQRISQETASFVADLLTAEELGGAQQRVAAVLADATAPAMARANAYLLAYWVMLTRGSAAKEGLVLAEEMAAWLPAGGAQLAGCDFADVAIFGANFANADLSGCSLDRCALWSGDFRGARLVGASLVGADLTEVKADAADFTDAHAERANAYGITLTSARLTGSSWVGADFAKANLNQADFSDADLRATHLALATGSPQLKGAKTDGLTWATNGSGAALQPTRPRPAFPWGHTGGVTSVVFSADGRRCLTGGLDYSARFWDTDSGVCLLTLLGHTDWTSSVALSPDGHRCLTGSRDHSARLWDADSGACLLTLSGHTNWVTSVAFSPDGRRCLTGSFDRSARLWDLETGDTLLTLRGHTSTVTCAAFSPDGRRCLTGSDDHSARLWDADSGAYLVTLQGHANGVTSVAFSPDDRRCITGSDDHSARLWDAESGACLLTLQGHSDTVTSVAISPDGRCCLSGSRDHSARLWDADIGACLITMQGHTNSVTSVAFSADGRSCITSSFDRSARLWDAASGACLFIFSGHTNWVTSVAFSSDGHRCLTGSWGDSGRLWDVDSGACLFTLQGHTDRVSSVAFSPDGRRYLTGSDDHSARLWDAQSGACILALQGHADGVTSIAFSPDGHRCLTGSDDKSARLWDADSGACILTLSDHTNRVTSAAFSPDGRRCLTGSRDSSARLWDADSGACLLTLSAHTNGVTSVAFSPDGRRCLTGSHDQSARLWDADSGACILTLQGHTDWVTSVAFSPDGRRCLTGSDDHSARLWDAQSGVCLLTLQGHTDRVNSVAVSPDGRHFLTGSVDNSARLWDLETGACLAWFWAEGDDWFWLDATRLDENGIVAHPGPLLRAGGRGAQRLKLADAAEKSAPWPWIPRLWPVADFPALIRE